MKTGEGKERARSAGRDRGPRRLLTLRQVADYLGVGRTTLLRTGLRLEVPEVRLGEKAKPLYDIRDLDEWIEKMKHRIA